MRVVQVGRFGGPEVLEAGSLPEPVAGAGEVVVGVTAANVMFLDTQLRGGWGGEYFANKPPYVPGDGVTGRVAALGDGVDPEWLGAEVVAATPGGAYAERVAVPAEALIRVPAGLDSRSALGLLHDGPTALLIAEAARFASGDRVLVTAATGGAGSLLVQLAHAAGAFVVAAARGRRKLDLALELGADAAVDYSLPDWPDRVRATTGGTDFDVVLDGVGGDPGRRYFELTGEGGRFVSYGATTGDLLDIPADQAAERGATTTGLFGLRPVDEAEKRELVRESLALALAGTWKPVIGQTYPLEDAAAAHAAMAARRTLGKTLLLI